MSNHADNCGKTFRTTKYGLPYTLICGLLPGHSGACHDLKNGARFLPDEPVEAE